MNTGFEFERQVKDWERNLNEEQLRELMKQTYEAEVDTLEAVVLDELLNVVLDLQKHRKQLQQKLADVARRTEQAQRILERGQTLNSLGEYQGMAGEADRLIGEHVLLEKHLVRAAIMVHRHTEWQVDGRWF